MKAHNTNETVMVLESYFPCTENKFLRSGSVSTLFGSVPTLCTVFTDFTLIIYSLYTKLRPLVDFHLYFTLITHLPFFNNFLPLLIYLQNRATRTRLIARLAIFKYIEVSMG